ncbi:MAG TPA: LuxR C-terminal-related transcriptional regulator [Thermomicrobiales bacterium]|nr:LuxR C-terminal-related transcriptional regulator [Thermomicrobiales bacterium]
MPDSPEVAIPSLPSGEFVGRDHELAQVISIVEQCSTRLLTIVGPGGVGKTRLALTAAWELSHLFRDGTFFISFAVADKENVWELVAHTLSIPDRDREPGPEALCEAICGALREREVLLILDNCEHVIDGFADLSKLLSRCPGVILIASSQEALRLRGEQELWLRPLALPEEDHAITAGAAEHSSAVELFVLRARKVDPNFELTDDNASDIAAIVRILDGLPLAIELAGAQTRHLSPAALRQRLEQDLPSLSGGPRDFPERQQSLMNMAAWSLSLLSPEERDRFLQLAVLVGDFTPEIAATVVEAPSPFDGWDTLLSFADKSLIKRVAGEAQSVPRFFILQTVQATTLRLLQQQPDLYVGACERHAAAYLSVAREAATHWHDREQLHWLRRMEQEHSNIQVILDRALTMPQLVERALELMEPMFWFWYTRGYHTWALPRIEQLLGIAPDDISPHVRGSAHVTAGWLAFEQRQVELADRHFRVGLQLLPDRASTAALWALLGTAYTLSDEGKNKAAAIRQMEEVIELASTNPAASFELGAGRFGIGLLEYFDRNLPAARSRFEKALNLDRACGDIQSIGMDLLYLAHIDRAGGNHRHAIHNLQQVLPIFLEVQDRANIVLGLDVVVSALAGVGAFDLGWRIATVSEHIRRTRGITRAPLEQPDFEDAIHRIREGLNLDPDEPLGTNQTALSLHDVTEEFLAFNLADAPIGASVTTANPRIETVLSPREMEVLQLVASGMTSSEIASSLYVSQHTVKRHMANIRQKLGVRSQAAAVAVLKQAG